ncbi:543_t:CDS:2 [Funneliformis mosseae]|uniref:543_t:CDS:1 n=1 Tax=Funneliformis mosseae TaxID=27381 RepID=A0A9N8Z069_FUNMO|nr:543_t:CDS:2 [Funneliformis mosseae]
MYIVASYDRWRYHFLPVIVIITMFFITSCVAQYDTNLTYLEDPANDLYLFDSYTKIDGTILLQFARYNNPDQTCIDPDVHLRIVFTDGTVKPLKVAHQIPLYNFCKIQSAFRNYFINDHEILITYLNGEDEATTIHTGMIIDFDGNIMQFVEFGIGVGKIVRSKDEENGFTWSRQVNETTIAWSRFAPMSTNPNQIVKLGSGYIISPTRSIINSYKMFKSDGGGVYFILSNKLNQTTAVDPIWNVYAIFIDKSNLEISTPYLLYQSQMDLFDINFIGCSDSNGEGHNCLMGVEMFSPKLVKKNNIVYFLLTFLTSGSVINFKKLDIGEDPNKEILEITVLLNRGFLVTCLSYKDKKRMGFFLTENGEYDGKWKGINNDVMTVNYFSHNDTVWGMLFQNSSASWTLITDQLRLVDNTKEILRQTYSGLSSQISISNHTSVSIEVLSSTFNNPSANYFISISNGFVNSKLYNEALPGIRKRVWYLNTSIEEPGLCLSSVIVLLRLNANGTKYFKKLNSKEIYGFYNELMDELSEIIPVERSRLSDSGKFQNDPSDSNNLVLMQVRISQPNETLTPCANDIAKDLAALINNKYLTLISHYPLSSMLDEKYGAMMIPEGWSDEFKLNLLYAFGGVLLVICLYFIARYKNPQGRNVFVFTIALIATDFILDLVFIVYNSKMVSSLFMPSIIFLVIPTVFNLIFTLYILLKEQYTNEQFRDWLISNTKVVSVLTILASADLAMLNIITSNLAGLSCFQVPLSKDAEVQIFRGRFVNIFIEEIPQFIIRVIYIKHNSIIYDPIPVFSLISVGLSILYSLVGRGFDTYKMLCTDKMETSQVRTDGEEKDYNHDSKDV